MQQVDTTNHRVDIIKWPSKDPNLDVGQLLKRYTQLDNESWRIDHVVYAQQEIVLMSSRQECVYDDGTAAGAS